MRPTYIVEKIVIQYTQPPHNTSCRHLAERERGDPVRPFMTLIISNFTDLSPESFHATPDTCAAACRDLIAAGVEDLKGNLINERVSVKTYPDRPREPVRLYPSPSSTKNEGVAHRGVIVALCVPPDPQLRRE